MSKKQISKPALESIGKDKDKIQETGFAWREEDAVDSGTYENELARSEQHYRIMRDKYARWCFIFMCVWSIIVFLYVLISGTPSCPVHFSYSVLITLLTGSTVNVIGLVVIILKGIFPKS